MMTRAAQTHQVGRVFETPALEFHILFYHLKGPLLHIRL